MKNNTLKLGVIFGIILAIGIITTNSIIESQINIKIIVSGIIGSAIGGLIFGLFMKYIFKIGNQIQINLQQNENIIKEGIANHIVKFDSVGGKLFLSNKRLIFKSHKINIHKHTIEIELNNISDCYKYKYLGIFSNRIKIITNENNIEKFVINKPNEWIETIKYATQHRLIVHTANSCKFDN